jgi:hypothetical protein
MPDNTRLQSQLIITKEERKNEGREKGRGVKRRTKEESRRP